MKLEIVVAHFQEDISWTKDLPCVIYDKAHGEHETVGGIPLPNIGREPHTYLHHIITRFYKLADVTVFCQGNPFIHCTDFLDEIQKEITTWTPFGIVWECGNLGQPYCCLEKLPEFHSKIFGFYGTPTPDKYLFIPGANFAVPRHLITDRQPPFWINVLSTMLEYKDGPWMMERLWRNLFV